MESDSTVIAKWILYFFTIMNACSSIISVISISFSGAPHGLAAMFIIEGIVILLFALFGFWGVRSGNSTVILTYGIVVAFFGCLRIIVAMVSLVTATIDPKSKSGNFPIAFYGIIQILIGTIAIVYSKALQSRSSEYRQNTFQEDSH